MVHSQAPQSHSQFIHADATGSRTSRSIIGAAELAAGRSAAVAAATAKLERPTSDRTCADRLNQFVGFNRRGWSNYVAVYWCVVCGNTFNCRRACSPCRRCGSSLCPLALPARFFTTDGAVKTGAGGVRVCIHCSVIDRFTLAEASPKQLRNPVPFARFRSHLESDRLASPLTRPHPRQ